MKAQPEPLKVLFLKATPASVELITALSAAFKVTIHEDENSIAPEQVKEKYDMLIVHGYSKYTAGIASALQNDIAMTFLMKSDHGTLPEIAGSKVLNIENLAVD
ncbi:MAG: hypothetical protein EOO01_37335, partial [Chitinophagaceae bacterium]